MRVVHAAALTAAAMLLASIGSAQGIGSAAARERAKRNSAPAKPAKVYSEGDLGASVAAPAPSPDEPATAPAGTAAASGAAAAGGSGAPGEASAPATAAGEGAVAPAGTETPTEGAPQAEGAGAPATEADKAAQEAAEQQAKAQQAWKKRLDQARQEEQVYRDVIDKLQMELNDTSGGFYNPGRASKIAFLEENKQKLAETQGRVAAIEEEGRRSGYR